MSLSIRDYGLHFLHPETSLLLASNSLSVRCIQNLCHKFQISLCPKKKISCCSSKKGGLSTGGYLHIVAWPQSDGNQEVMEWPIRGWGQYV